MKTLLMARVTHRQVIEDPSATYFGGMLSKRSLIPAGEALLGSRRFQEWLNQSAEQTAALAPAAGVCL